MKCILRGCTSLRLSVSEDTEDIRVLEEMDEAGVDTDSSVWIQASVVMAANRQVRLWRHVDLVTQVTVSLQISLKTCPHSIDNGRHIA